MTDTTKTRAQLIQRAGINLGLIQPGEDLASEDYNTLDDLVDPAVDQLAADTVIYIQDRDAIDTEVFLPLAAIIANMAGPSFGSPINDDAMTRDKGTLKRIAATRPTYEPLRTDYF